MVQTVGGNGIRQTLHERECQLALHCLVSLLKLSLHLILQQLFCDLQEAALNRFALRTHRSELICRQPVSLLQHLRRQDEEGVLQLRCSGSQCNLTLLCVFCPLRRGLGPQPGKGQVHARENGGYASG